MFILLVWLPNKIPIFDDIKLALILPPVTVQTILVVVCDYSFVSCSDLWQSLAAPEYGKLPKPGPAVAPGLGAPPPQKPLSSFPSPTRDAGLL